MAPFWKKKRRGSWHFLLILFQENFTCHWHEAFYW